MMEVPPYLVLPFTSMSVWSASIKVVENSAGQKFLFKSLNAIIIFGNLGSKILEIIVCSGSSTKLSLLAQYRWLAEH